MKTLKHDQKLSILSSINPSVLDKLKFEDLVLYFCCAVGTANREYQWEGLQALNRRLNRATILEAMSGNIMRRVLLGLFSEDTKSLPTCRFSLGSLNQFLNTFYPNLAERLVRAPAERKSADQTLHVFEKGSVYNPNTTYVIVRKHWWPGNSATRAHPFWYLIPQFFRDLGLDPVCIDAGDFNATLQALSSVKANDLVFIDLEVGHWPDDAHERIRSALTANKPKVIGLVGDHWRAKNVGFFDHYAEAISCIWGGPPSEDARETSSTASSGCARSFFPMPMTKEVIDLAKGSDAQGAPPAFRGTIEENNFPRLLWYSLLGGREDFRFELSSITDDHLPARESYLEYTKANIAQQVICNFAARSTGQLIMTGRLFEGIWNGRTLLQEWCPALSQFYVDGEHLLSFSTYAELEILLDRLRGSTDPLKIGRQAREFASRNYSVEQWYSHLCSFF